ncbi:MAG: QacE family quaternary ammonium compound efflux SMR transporter [Proteobacteria bacterium]|nr:QacE family quaternary ammonium compound efflux SMR transporter [Pseudomonadota bacterium]
MGYLYLAIAIAGEVVATSSLKASREFTRLGPSVLVIGGYALAFYCMTLALRTMPLGVVYAMWSGLGIALIVAAGAVLYDQIPDAWALVGMGLIVAGVIVIHTMSKMSVH